MTAITTVFLVENDRDLRDSSKEVLEAFGFIVKSFASARSFLSDRSRKSGCLVADVQMPDMDGVQLLEEIRRREFEVSSIVVADQGDVSFAVRAIKAGAVNFIEKPYDHDTLLANVLDATNIFHSRHEAFMLKNEARDRIRTLTRRELEVLEKIVSGESNKMAAHELGISPRTIEIHRSNIMHKLEAHSLATLVRIALAAQHADGT